MESRETNSKIHTETPGGAKRHTHTMSLEQPPSSDENSSENSASEGNSSLNSIEPPEIKPQTNKDIYKSFIPHMIKTPFPIDYTQNERNATSANRKTSDEQVLIFSIMKEDFKTDGKYAHLHIPNYPYVPLKIMNDLGFIVSTILGRLGYK